MTLISIAGLLVIQRLASTAVLLQLEGLLFIEFALQFLVQVTSTEHGMPCAFMLCALEINKNGGFKLEHVESCHSSKKKHHNSTTTMPVTTNIDRVVTYHEGLHP